MGLLHEAVALEEGARLALASRLHHPLVPWAVPVAADPLVFQLKVRGLQPAGSCFDPWSYLFLVEPLVTSAEMVPYVIPLDL